MPAQCCSTSSCPSRPQVKVLTTSRHRLNSSSAPQLGTSSVAQTPSPLALNIRLGVTDTQPYVLMNCYAVAKRVDGSILLTPLASIPKRELLVWDNAELRASLFRGLADAAEGNVRTLDWVTADVADDE